MNNSNFRITYTLSDNLFAKPIADYKTSLNKKIDELNSLGLNARIEKSASLSDGEINYYFYIGTSGMSIFYEQFEILQQVANEQNTDEILNILRIDGVTLDNYKSYLE